MSSRALASKRRHFKRLAVKANELLTDGGWQSLQRREQMKIVRKLKDLYRLLSSYVPEIELRRMLATAAILIGLSMPAQAQWFSTPQLNPFNISGSAASTHAAFGDLDGDGDLDIMMSDPSGDFRYFQNTGSASSPNFTTSQLNPYNLSNVGNYQCSSLVDLDNDGDLDIFTTVDIYYNSHIRFYLNTGTSISPSFASPVVNPFGITVDSVYGVKSPAFVDIDNDSDFDLFLLNDATYAGLLFYENTGNASTPAFGAPVFNPFGIGGMGSPYYTFYIAFADIDKDGDQDLFSSFEGNYLSYIYLSARFYRNTGTPSSPSFAVPLTDPFNISLDGGISITFADIDSDSDIDMFNQDQGTGTYFLRNTCVFGISETEIACNSYTWHGNTYTFSGTYKYNIPNTSGCDTSITLNLTINYVDVSVTSNDPTLTANETGAAYQWLDCDNAMAAITGETGQSFTASANGNYAVSITKNGCTDTSVCYPISAVGIIENSFGDLFYVYPSPTTDKFIIDLGQEYKGLTVQVSSVDSRIISKTLFTSGRMIELEIDGAKGLYLVHIHSGQGQGAILKVLKN